MTSTTTYGTILLAGQLVSKPECRKALERAGFRATPELARMTELLRRVPQFVQDLRDGGFGAVSARPAMAKRLRHLGCSEIRSRKNSLLAYGWDGLGNMTALCADGHIRVFLAGSEVRLALAGRLPTTGVEKPAQKYF